MEEKKHSINRTDEMTEETGTSGTTGSTSSSGEGNDDTGITQTQLNNIRTNPSDRAAGSGGSRPFITGTDSDGQV
jgi:hypothetical protein